MSQLLQIVEAKIIHQKERTDLIIDSNRYIKKKKEKNHWLIILKSFHHRQLILLNWSHELGLLTKELMEAQVLYKLNLRSLNIWKNFVLVFNHLFELSNLNWRKKKGDIRKEKKKLRNGFFFIFISILFQFQFNFTVESERNEFEH